MSKAKLLYWKLLYLLEQEARRDGRMPAVVLADVFKKVRKRLVEERGNEQGRK